MSNPEEHPELAHAEFVAELNMRLMEDYWRFFTAAVMHGCFTCGNCGRTLPRGQSLEAAAAEARAAGFTEAEIADPAEVCDECWRMMRAAMPDLDARYGDSGEGQQ